MMHGMYGNGLILMIVFWVVLIGLGIYLLTRFINGNNKNSKNNEAINNKQTPLQILQERLVRGEIDKEEYERLKSIIQRDRE